MLRWRGGVERSRPKLGRKHAEMLWRLDEAIAAAVEEALQFETQIDEQCTYIDSRPVCHH